MDTPGYILKARHTNPPRYLRDYRHAPSCLWTGDERCAEVFARLIDAKEISERLSWIRQEPFEIVMIGEAGALFACPCILNGCENEADPQSSMCTRHRQMGYQRAEREMHEINTSKTIRPGILTPEQEQEAAFHMAKQALRIEMEADLMDLMDDFEGGEDSDAILKALRHPSGNGQIKLDIASEF